MKTHRIDVRPFLPDGWRASLRRAALGARAVTKPGAGPGSLHLGDAAGLDYRTLNRAELLETVPWLGGLHERVGLHLLRLAEGEPQVVDMDDVRLGIGEAPLAPITEPHGLSLNVVTPDSAIGGGYEWHVDGADHAFVCVLTTEAWGEHDSREDAYSDSPENTGGRFLWHDGKVVHREVLEPGVLMCLESSRYPHAVEPPREVKKAPGRDARSGERISVMLAYTRLGMTREAGLTTWLGQEQ